MNCISFTSQWEVLIASLGDIYLNNANHKTKFFWSPVFISKFSHGLVVIYTILLATTKNESDFLIPFAQVVSINMEVSLYLSHIFSWKGGFCRFTGSQLGLKVCLISWMLLCYYTIVRRKFKMGNQRVKRLNKNDT